MYNCVYICVLSADCTHDGGKVSECSTCNKAIEQLCDAFTQRYPNAYVVFIKYISTFIHIVLVCLIT